MLKACLAARFPNQNHSIFTYLLALVKSLCTINKYYFPALFSRHTLYFTAQYYKDKIK